MEKTIKLLNHYQCYFLQCYEFINKSPKVFDNLWVLIITASFKYNWSGGSKITHNLLIHYEWNHEMIINDDLGIKV